MDAATGLLYVGNGQYYDPTTGRFLTRDGKPNNPNPYVPWNPIGAIFTPLAVLSMFYIRKRKRSKWDILIIIVVLGMAAGMTVAACGPTPPITPVPQPTANSTATPDNSAPGVPPGAQTSGGLGNDPGSTPGGAIQPLETPTIPCLTPLENVPAPIFTSTPSPYIEPWKRYKDYDPATNSIPRDKWGGLDSNSWDADRSELVWGWLGEAQGKWWNGQYPDAQELTTWLLWQESGSLFSESLGDNVYGDGGGMGGAKLMIRFMKRLFSDGVDKLDLARFTAFYNPNSGGAFDQGDWNELMTAPKFNPYGLTVSDFWGLEPLNEELTWWVPGEPGFNYKPVVTVRHPNGSGDILYFAYK